MGRAFGWMEYHNFAAITSIAPRSAGTFVSAAKVVLIGEKAIPSCEVPIEVLVRFFFRFGIGVFDHCSDQDSSAA